MGTRTSLPNDLVHAEWAQVERLIPAPKKGRRPARRSRREVVDAPLYVARTGRRWRAPTHDLPPRATVHWHFRPPEGRRHLRPPDGPASRRPPPGPRAAVPAVGRHYRLAIGRDGREEGSRGYDAGKQVRGRKRPIRLPTTEGPEEKATFPTGCRTAGAAERASSRIRSATARWTHTSRSRRRVQARGFGDDRPSFQEP